MDFNKIIVENIRARKMNRLFPKLPKIVKRNDKKRLVVNEINPGHTESVFRGYLKRVKNFNKK